MLLSGKKAFLQARRHCASDHILRPSVGKAQVRAEYSTVLSWHARGPGSISELNTETKKNRTPGTVGAGAL